MRLGPGEYFGGTKWSRQVRGVLLTISTYQASQTQPWHCHANPTFFVLLTGKHRDHTRCADVDQSALSLVFHPTTNPHAGEVGPLGMRGMNIEYPAEWLERHGLGDEDLSRYRPLESAGARLSVLQVLATAFQPGDQMDAEIETLVLELLAQVVSWPEPVIESFAPKWLRTAEEFLRANFRQAISLRDVAHESKVHPVYLARVFRRKYGQPVSEHLRALRVAEAGRLILEGASLADAAYAAGFADQSHFSRSCSQIAGFSPKFLLPARHAVRN